MANRDYCGNIEFFVIRISSNNLHSQHVFEKMGAVRNGEESDLNQKLWEKNFMIFKENVLDFDIYNSLRKSVDWSVYPEEQARGALENTYYSLVAYVDDEAVGMSRVISDGIYFLIVDVVVVPKYQGQGIGTEMMQHLIQYIDKKTPAGSRSSIQLLSMTGKENFYEKQGFKRLPNEYCGCGMRKIIHKENM